MKIKSFLAKPYAAIIYNKVNRQMKQAVADQQSTLEMLLITGNKTAFGQDHGFKEVKEYKEFRQAVPIRDYEQLSPYIDRIKAGEQNILWKGKPMYFAKTSGTTSGTQDIPISRASIHNHIDTAKYALLVYMATSGNASFANGKMIFLSGSPILERVAGIPTGRLSGIVNHFIPGYLRGNQLPSYTTNCIEDWEEKLAKIIAETISSNMTLISGIPPWMQMYFDWLQERSGKKIKELFPNLQVLVHGGVNFEPYRNKLMESLGGPVDTIETFPASEGFFAYQNDVNDPGLLLNTDSGIFFEFIPSDQFFQENPPRFSLSEVSLGVNYVLIINSNAGLWGYNIGDTIRFVSLDPYKIMVTGRIKHFISAFGEHVIGEEVDHSMQTVAARNKTNIIEFTVAPQVQTSGELPYHEWLISFEQPPHDLREFALQLDQTLRAKNSYYDDLIKGNILQPLKITPLQSDAFIQYMRSVGKLGGQNKVPRLSNDRNIADALGAWKKDLV